MSPGASVPWLTVAIPCFNSAPTLDEAVRSALGQSGDFSLEVLVSDNASGDATPEILRRFEGPAGFRWVRQAENLGMEANFRFCLEGAKGEWLLFLGADDTLEPGALARALDVLRARPEVRVLFGGWRWRGERAGEELPPSNVPEGREAVLDSLATARNYGHLSATFLHTESARSFGIHPMTFFDWLLFLDLAWRYPVAFLREPLASVRAHEANETRLRYGRSPASHCRSLMAVLSEFAATEGSGDARVRVAVKEGSGRLLGRYAALLARARRNGSARLSDYLADAGRLLVLPSPAGARARAAAGLALAMFFSAPSEGAA